MMNSSVFHGRAHTRNRTRKQDTQSREDPYLENISDN